jgi:hypothetical protein
MLNKPNERNLRFVHRVRAVTIEGPGESSSITVASTIMVMFLAPKNRGKERVRFQFPKAAWTVTFWPQNRDVFKDPCAPKSVLYSLSRI